MAATIDEDRLSETFAALANSTRRAILARLAEGGATVNELAEPFEMTLPAISKHIKVLERAGLVVRGQRAQYRPCALDPAPLEEVSTWAERYRPVWEARFDRMDDYLRQLQPQMPRRRCSWRVMATRRLACPYARCDSDGIMNISPIGISGRQLSARTLAVTDSEHSASATTRHSVHIDAECFKASF